jgi:hypothetical protein
MSKLIQETPYTKQPNFGNVQLKDESMTNIGDIFSWQTMKIQYDKLNFGTSGPELEKIKGHFDQLYKQFISEGLIDGIEISRLTPGSSAALERLLRESGYRVSYDGKLTGNEVGLLEVSNGKLTAAKVVKLIANYINHQSVVAENREQEISRKERYAKYVQSIAGSIFSGSQPAKTPSSAHEFPPLPMGIDLGNLQDVYNNLNNSQKQSLWDSVSVRLETMGPNYSRNDLRSAIIDVLNKNF